MDKAKEVNKPAPLYTHTVVPGVGQESMQSGRKPRPRKRKRRLRAKKSESSKSH